MSVGYPDEDEEWIDINDEDGIDAWVLGYGNPFENSDPVGDILMKIDESSVREMLLDDYVKLLSACYQIDIEEFKDSDEATKWDEVSEEMKGALL